MYRVTKFAINITAPYFDYRSLMSIIC
uniref:Uncharacterized protein n=1 Tax=Anguilla anguilla TaxID=7936 RepID=A0A0E9QPD1_ANGAN